jgi:hypothetical protein
MPSEVHQSLLLWAAHKMLQDGFVLGGFEGPASRAGVFNALPPPFELGGHRPDAWGVDLTTGTIGFAEAKTFDDIDNDHTRSQLRIFGFTQVRATRAPCPLYIAIPRSAVYELDRVLIAVGLIRARHILRLHVPDSMLA